MKEVKEYYCMTSEEVISQLSIRKDGLNDQMVIESRQKNGENVLAEEDKKSLVRVFLEQFADLLVIILIISAIVSMFTGNVESAVVILCVITMNAILGTIQHFKAEKSLEGLRAMSAPNARVIRSGVVSEIPASEVAVGDYLLLEAGNIAAADGRLTEAAMLLINESALTGESLNVLKSSDALNDKNSPLGDRINMVYSGSIISNGRGALVVTAVGMGTEIGKIAGLMHRAEKKKTPLQINLDTFSKWLSVAIMVICAFVMALSIFVQHRSIIDSLMFAVALAVAAIPEALSSIITISLAIGTQKMSKENAIIKELKAVEGLGCVSVICSDKTGTLTQNKMTVRDVCVFDETEKTDLHRAMALCNDAVVNGDCEIGDPTETSLLCYLGNKQCARIKSEYKRIEEIPFDSDRKLMSTVHYIDGKKVMFTKGAVDVILPRLSSISKHGMEEEVTEADIEYIRAKNLEYSEKGMRVLAFAKKIIDSEQKVQEEDESDFIFIGMTAMTDPPRVESPAAIQECINAGIKPVMITGDHKLTAVAIAKEIGIFREGDKCLEGVEIDAVSDEELTAQLEKISVYARVSPTHKIRIVDLWQKKGNIVAMTGDGVNDAPALKKADIGVAMGITGTEVSKDAASMILADDNFATIIRSVANGRGIYSNIKNAVKFLLAGNMAAIIVVLITSIFNMPIPFSAVHLLFINLLTDSLPAIALCMEPLQKHLMLDKPRSTDEFIINKDSGLYIAVHSVMLASMVFIAYFTGLSISNGVAATSAFAVLCLGRLFEGFNCRGKGSLLRMGIMSNYYSLLAFMGGVLLLASVIFIPAFHSFMEVASLDMERVGLVVLLAFIPFAITQIVRMVRGK